jgi:hypothetical protein
MYVVLYFTRLTGLGFAEWFRLKGKHHGHGIFSGDLRLECGMNQV